jgi:deoxyribose-phosphate aldolase
VYSRKVTVEEVARMIDHTNLKPFATKKEIHKLCEEAKKYNFAAVCVNSSHISLCYGLLSNSDVEVAAVVGFPLGACTSEAKAFETQQSIHLGAHEVDMVMNIGKFIEEDYTLVRRDIEKVVNAAEGAKVKVILETGYLNDEQIIKACQIIKEANAHFVKTSTGFGPMGAFYDHVKLMRQTVGEDFGVKAAGGIRDAKAAVRMINAGADRLGASAGIAIINSLKEVINEGKWFSSEDDDPAQIYSWGAADPKKQPKEVYDFYIQKKDKFQG